jgi:acyl carrier protein
VDASPYDLTVTMTPREHGHELTFQCPARRFPAGTLTGLVSAVETLAGALAERPGRPLADVATPSLTPLTLTGPTDPAVLAVRDRERDAPVDEGLVADIRAIWCEVLGLVDLDPRADLFELGGDSLAITKIVARVRERLGTDVPAWTLYEEPTVAGFASALSRTPD